MVVKCLMQNKKGKMKNFILPRLVTPIVQISNRFTRDLKLIVDIKC